MAKLLDLLRTIPMGTRVRRTSEAHGGKVCFLKDADGEEIFTVSEGFELTRDDFEAYDWEAVWPPELWIKVSRVQARNLLSKGRVIRRASWTDPGQNLGGIMLRNGSIVYRKSGLYCNCLHRLFDKTVNDWQVLLPTPPAT